MRDVEFFGHLHVKFLFNYRTIPVFSIILKNGTAYELKLDLLGTRVGYYDVSTMCTKMLVVSGTILRSVLQASLDQTGAYLFLRTRKEE